MSLVRVAERNMERKHTTEECVEKKYEEESYDIFSGAIRPVNIIS